MDLSSLMDTNSYTHRALASMHEFYLLGEVKGPEEYTGWFDVIRNCGEHDIIKLHINSEGGSLLTAIQFLRVLNDCNGKVITSVEGSCMSAATMIFLCADEFEISPHSIFMFHNYSTIMGGSGGELYKAIMHNVKWTTELMQEVYDGVLTPDEIHSISGPNDGTIYLSGHDVEDRLRSKIESMQKEAEEAAIEAAHSEMASSFTISVEDQGDPIDME